MANKRKSKIKRNVGYKLTELRYGYIEAYNPDKLLSSDRKLRQAQLLEQSQNYLSSTAYQTLPFVTTALKTLTPVTGIYALSYASLDKIPGKYKLLNWYRGQPFAQLYKTQFMDTPGLATIDQLYAGDLIYQAVVSAEVNGPGFVSWLQPSANISPIAINPANKQFKIPGREIRKDLEYWKLVVDKNNYPGYFETIKEDLINLGIVIKDGVPYIDDGTFTKAVAPRARIAQKFLQLERGQQLSQTWLAHRARLTGKYHPGSYKSSWGILLGKSDEEIILNWFRSIGRSYMLRYFRVLDDPLEYLTQISGIETGFEQTSLYKLFRNKLGVGGAEYYGKPLLNLVGRHLGLVTKNLIVPYYGLKTLHETIKDIPLPGNAGIFTPAVYTLASLDFLRATVGTPFRLAADSLDALAPGTSSLGIVFGNVAQVGITGYLLGKSYNYLRRTDVWKDTYNILDRYFRIPSQVEKLTEPINKLEYFKFKTAKTRVFTEELLDKIPDTIRRWIPKSLETLRATPAGKVGIYAAGTMLALSSLNIVGGVLRLLGGSKDLGDLIDEYTGKKKVPQYATRFWIFGQSYILGQDATYMGENWFNRAIHDYRGKTIWRNNEPGAFRAIKETPILQDIIAPYYVEEATYRSQPYPVTGPSQEFPGFLGPIYASTIGQLFKPTRYMHTQEWAVPENYMYKKIQPYKREALFNNVQLMSQTGTPNILSSETHAYASITASGVTNTQQSSIQQDKYVLNVTKPSQGKPFNIVQNPYDPYITAGKTLSYLEEAIGLPGYAFRISMANPDTWYTKYLELQNATDLTSISEQFYYANLGDPGYTEAIRRVIINQANSRKPFNLIPNDQPYWMPDAGFYIKTRHGDPYRSIFEGYARVPGPGLTERAEFAHLKNVPYEEYPLEDRLKILGDIAYTSEEFKETYAVMLYDLQHSLIKNPRYEDAIKQVQKSFVEKLDSRKFLPYDDNTPGILKFQSMINRLSSPVGEILFTSPKEKFSVFETPIESYKHRVIQGNESAIWSHPWRDFIRPFIGRVAGMFTDEPMPWVKKHRTNEMYLDYLKYFKFSIAAKQAQNAGNVEAANKFKSIASTTAVAVNPYKSIFELLPALPKEERPYFIKFASETDPYRREKILEMTSPVMKRIYKARWELLDYANKSENAPSKEKLKEHIAYATKREEDLMNLDIVREARKMSEVYGKDYDIPQGDWEGYRMQTSMTEIKVGFLQSIGEDPIDYRIPKKEIQMLNQLTNPSDLFNDITAGPDLTNSSYVITDTLFRKAKSIIYKMNQSDSIPTTVLSLEYKPKLKYVWERDN